LRCIDVLSAGHVGAGVPGRLAVDEDRGWFVQITNPNALGVVPFPDEADDRLVRTEELEILDGVVRSHGLQKLAEYPVQLFDIFLGNCLIRRHRTPLAPKFPF
jgi:hypothetical protein